MNGVIDNDVLFKGICYGLLAELADYVGGGQSIGVLGAARFVVARTIRRRPTAQDTTTLLTVLDGFLKGAIAIEPDSVEEQLAADLQLAAQLRGLALDTGESQLCAVCIVRDIAVLLTGDKQAIAAMEQLSGAEPRLLVLAAKVRCLEQAILSISTRMDHHDLRGRVCKERDVDMALSMCFSCWSSDTSADAVRIGLRSYIESLRGEATRMLAAS